MERSLVEKRQSFIRRMTQLRPETVDVRVAGKTPEGSGPPNRHGMPQVPPGQRRVRNWPVLDLGCTPEISPATWELVIEGNIENPCTLDWEGFLALPQVEDVSDFHCVTGWSRLDNHWKGVPFSALAEFVVPKDDARFVRFTGYDRAPGTQVPYTTSLPLARALDPDVLLVHSWEGRPLPLEHGGPVRVVTPRLYAWKGAKWIHCLSFLSGDAPGFWEARGYSNSAQPWFEDRYSRDESR